MFSRQKFLQVMFSLLTTQVLCLLIWFHNVNELPGNSQESVIINIPGISVENSIINVPSHSVETVIINLPGHSVTPGGAHMRRHPHPHPQHFWAETCINQT